MLYYYFASFIKKCLNKLTRPNEFHHVSWKELIFYTVRQAYHTYKKTYKKSLSTYRYYDENTTALDTPYGIIYVPRSVDAVELHYLMREAFDKKHWHQYDTQWTPVEPNDTVVDCGSSEGLWACSIVNRAGKLYLIEPQEAFAKALEKTFLSHIINKKVIILKCAVGSFDGTCRVLQQHDADILSTVIPDEHSTIPMYRIDTLFDKTPVNFIKADVEGFEMELLCGAREVIKRDKPKMAITVYHESNNWKELRDYVTYLVPSYQWKLKGMVEQGKPLMLHMWAHK